LPDRYPTSGRASARSKRSLAGGTAGFTFCTLVPSITATQLGPKLGELSLVWLALISTTAVKITSTGFKLSFMRSTLPLPIAPVVDFDAGCIVLLLLRNAMSSSSSLVETFVASCVMAAVEVGTAGASLVVMRCRLLNRIRLMNAKRAEIDAAVDPEVKAALEAELSAMEDERIRFVTVMLSDFVADAVLEHTTISMSGMIPLTASRLDFVPAELQGASFGARAAAVLPHVAVQMAVEFVTDVIIGMLARMLLGEFTSVPLARDKWALLRIWAMMVCITALSAVYVHWHGSFYTSCVDVDAGMCVGLVNGTIAEFEHGDGV